MTDRPLLMSSPMVRATLAELKTQTRRVQSPQPTSAVFDNLRNPDFWNCFKKGEGWGRRIHTSDVGQNIDLRYAVGDRLWVRETTLFWIRNSDNKIDKVAAYAADGYELEPGERWTPAIHMPRWASRLTLIVTGVKVERLQDISEEDAIAEGVERDDGGHGMMAGYSFKSYDKPGYIVFSAVESFKSLWQSLNAKRAPWETNPWVVAIAFKAHKCNIERMAG